MKIYFQDDFLQKMGYVVEWTEGSRGIHLVNVETRAEVEYRSFGFDLRKVTYATARKHARSLSKDIEQRLSA